MPTAERVAPAASPLATERLSDQLAAQLRALLDSGTLAPGARLPTELALGKQFGVSRTVVREAVSRLRTMGLLVARQGSGVFVAAQDAARPLAFDATVLADLDAVLEVVEVRRALESEVAALAAERATPAQRTAIERALRAVDASVASGSAAVDDDLAFHRCIAEAAGNSQFPRLLRHLAQYLRDAMAVTRRNESREADFMDAVRQEHRAIVDAILARDPAAARAAAAGHMHQAAVRLHLYRAAQGLQAGAAPKPPPRRRRAAPLESPQ
jgi:GntR family transcriptional repressor for pyruvate dehydrogenase complex